MRGKAEQRQTTPHCEFGGNAGQRRSRSAYSFLLLGSVLALFPSLLSAQEQDYATPDAVASFTTGEGGGRGSEYLPENVLGLPDTVGRATVATIDPKQILSLGLDGEIILRFDRAYIVDGPGVDFTVFENAFAYRLGGKDKLYAEPGEVAVSRDGEVFTPFPYDPTTLVGCAGVTPTNGDQPPYDPSVSGGDGFDLATIGVDSVRFIRIRDITRIVKENTDHPYYDVTLNGFDLDAIVALNTQTVNTVSGVPDLAAVDGVHLHAPAVILNSSSLFIPLDLTLPRSALVRIALTGIAGNQIVKREEEMAEGRNHVQVATAGLAAGTYFLTVWAEGIGQTGGSTTTRVIRILH